MATDDETDDKPLVQAMQPFRVKSTEALRTTAQTALEGLDDVEVVVEDEEKLLGIDGVQTSRIIYVTSLLRLADFLRATPNDFDAKQKQAQMAFNYLKHVEDGKLKALKFGRAAGDNKLARAVAEMRGEISQLAEYRASRKGKNGEKASGQASEPEASAPQT